MKLNSWRPNWKEPDKYPKIEKGNLIQWYWEFLRRRNDYQELFKEFSRNKKSIEADIPNFKTLFKINYCPNPTNDFDYVNKQKELIWAFDDELFITSFLEPDDISIDVNVTCEPNHLLCKFDLDVPLELQLKTLKHSMDIFQTLYLRRKNKNNRIVANKLTTPTRRRHESKWINYLRALDARYSNEIYEDIGLIVGNEDLSEDDLEDKLCDKGSDYFKSNGEKLVSAAMEVQFNFPF